MAGPWEQYAAPADGPWTQYQAPAQLQPKRAAPAPAPKPRGFLETIGDNFTAPIKQAVSGLNDVNARKDEQDRRIAAQSLSEKFLNAPKEIALGLKNDIDKGLAIGNVALSPIAGAVNTVTKPTADAVSNALYDRGVRPYADDSRFPFDPSVLGKQPRLLSREEAAQQMNNDLTTAISLGLPEKAGPPRPPKLRTTPKVNPDVTLLRSRGVDVLPGAAKGGVAKGLEDRAAKLPVVGTKIQQARHGTIESFNKALVNDALAPIGETLPSDIPAGHPANAHAYDAIQGAYRTNQPSRPVILPRDFADVTQHPDFGILAPESQAALDRIMKNRILTKAPSGELDGRNFGKAVELLREDIKRTGAQGGEEKIVSGILKDKLDELIGEASVQDPAYAARKELLDTAYAKIKTLQRASQSLGADNGVVMPSQYLNAVKATDSSAGKNRFATGRAFNQDFAQAAKNVLSDKVANTGGEAGIMGNAIVGLPSTVGALIGGPLGAGLGFAGGAGGLYGASKLYEPAAIAKFNAGLDRKIAGTSAVQLPRTRVNIAPVTPLLAASNLSQEIAALPPLVSKAAAEPPRKRKRKK